MQLESRLSQEHVRRRVPFIFAALDLLLYAAFADVFDNWHTFV